MPTNCLQNPLVLFVRFFGFVVPFCRERKYSARCSKFFWPNLFLPPLGSWTSAPLGHGCPHRNACFFQDFEGLTKRLGCCFVPDFGPWTKGFCRQRHQNANVAKAKTQPSSLTLQWFLHLLTGGRNEAGVIAGHPLLPPDLGFGIWSIDFAPLLQGLNGQPAAVT